MFPAFSIFCKLCFLLFNSSLFFHKSIYFLWFYFYISKNLTITLKKSIFTSNFRYMNIHEYQGKAILKSFGVSIQEGIVVDTPEEALDAAKKLKEEYNSDWVVIKAQIHAGGRGKGGGVKLAKNHDEVVEHAKNILGMQLVTPQTGPEGKKVN